MSDPYVFYDGDGAALIIVGNSPDGVVVKATAPVAIRPHELAGVAAELYRAAGQAVPELPVIFDPEAVRRLAGLLHFARYGVVGGLRDGGPEAEARVLLAHGVRLPDLEEATS